MKKTYYNVTIKYRDRKQTFEAITMNTINTIIRDLSNSLIRCEELHIIISLTAH